MSNQDIDDQKNEEYLQKIQEEADNYLTEAYEDFKDRITNNYLILNAKQQMDGGKFEKMQEVLKMVPGNSTKAEIDVKTTCATLFCWLICPYIWLKTRSIFEVPANKFAFVVYESEEDGDKTVIYGPGYHILGYEHKLEGIYSFDDDVPNNIIQSSVGDLKIAKVEQGFIMHLEYGGQNILLGPGIHKIDQPLRFVNYISLDGFYISIGPEKWVTIPTGYDGISLNRGKLKILSGGEQHYLPHVSDKFVKIVPKTIQTDKIPTDIPSYVAKLTSQDEQQIINRKNKHRGGNNYRQVEDENDPTLFLRTTTAEGSTVTLDTMLQWRILDTKLAALTAMEILKVGSIGNEQTNEQDAITASSKNICNLRLTVLRIAKNHLTCTVGSISLSGKSSLGAQIKEDVDPELVENDEDDQPLMNEEQQGKQSNFDILGSLQNGTTKLRDMINKDLKKIGCVVDNVCIYRVSPSRDIQSELDKQTKAKVDANTAIIQAQSKQKATKIDMDIKMRNALVQAESNAKVLKMEAQSYADAKITRATGEADAITTVATARKEEAEQLQEYKVAKTLALTRVAGEAGEKIFQGSSSNVVFGNNPGDVISNMVNSFSGKRGSQ